MASERASASAGLRDTLGRPIEDLRTVPAPIRGAVPGG